MTLFRFHDAAIKSLVLSEDASQFISVDASGLAY